MTSAAAQPPFLVRHADIIFSVKTFIAGMMALLIGFAMDLPRPYWALATVYIASQPLAGAYAFESAVSRHRHTGWGFGQRGTGPEPRQLAGTAQPRHRAVGRSLSLCVAAGPHAARLHVHAGGYTCALISFPRSTNPQRSSIPPWRAARRSLSASSAPRWSPRSCCRAASAQRLQRGSIAGSPARAG